MRRLTTSAALITLALVLAAAPLRGQHGPPEQPVEAPEEMPAEARGERRADETSTMASTVEAGGVYEPGTGVASLSPAAVVLLMAAPLCERLRCASEVTAQLAIRALRIDILSVEYAIDGMLAARAGLYRTPLGRYNATHDGPRSCFSGPPLEATAVIPGPLSELGVGVVAALPLGACSLQTELHLVRASQPWLGRTVGIPRFEWHADDAQQSATAIAGRVAVCDGERWECGLSYRSATATIPGAVAALDAAMQTGGTAVRVEAALAGPHRHLDAAGTLAGRRHGAVVELVRSLGHLDIATWSSTELLGALRAEWCERDAHSARLDTDAWTAYRGVTAALALRPTALCTVRFNAEWRVVTPLVPARRASLRVHAGFATYL